MKSRINKEKGIYLSFPKIRKSGCKISFPIMYMQFDGHSDEKRCVELPNSDRTKYNIDLPKRIRMEYNRWKQGDFSSTEYCRNQEVFSYVYSVMQSVSGNMLWIDDENATCPNFCSVNFKNRTAIYVFNEWENYKIIKSDSDVNFHFFLQNFCLHHVKIKDPIEDFYVKSKLKTSQANKKFFTQIFTVDLSEWLGEWCGGVIEACF